MTSRRGFLQAIVSAGIAPSLPAAVSLVRATPPVSVPGLFRGEPGRYEGIKFLRTTQRFDYVNRISIAVFGTIGERKAMRAATFPAGFWHNAEPSSRDFFWKLLEAEVSRSLAQLGAQS